VRIPGSFDWDRPQQDVPARTGVGLGRVARVRERPRPRGPADDDREKSIEASTRGPTSRPLARGCPSASARAEGGSLRFVEVGGILVDLFSRHVGLWGSGQGRGGGDLVLVHGCGEGGHRPRFPSGPCRAGRADTERILRAGAEREYGAPLPCQRIHLGEREGSGRGASVPPSASRPAARTSENTPSPLDRRRRRCAAVPEVLHAGVSRFRRPKACDARLTFSSAAPPTMWVVARLQPGPVVDRHRHDGVTRGADR